MKKKKYSEIDDEKIYIEYSEYIELKERFRNLAKLNLRMKEVIENIAENERVEHTCSHSDMAKEMLEFM